MRLFTQARLRAYWEREPHAKEPLIAWFREIRRAAWATPADIKQHYGSASILRHGRVVFNIGGNKYRLVAHVMLSKRSVYVRFIGTHEEYDEIDAEEI